MIKAVIFDLDGVIVNTAKYHYLAWKHLANSLGFDVTEEQNEHLKGVSRVKSLDIILEWGGIEIGESQKEALLIQKNKEYLDYIDTLSKTDILPGVKEVLDYLKLSDKQIALGSASKNAKPILEKLEILNLFDVIVDGNSVKKAKPNPEVFLNAADKLNIAPKFCVVVEDAKAGIEAANSADMISVGIGDKLVLNEANYVLEDTSKLSIDFLKVLLKN
ncbi:MAG: beta-phosphoglucomutase [Flavobacteriaceae bacterium]